jgi:hypothetical protein
LPRISIDGTFAELETGVVPFRIGDEEFHTFFVLVNGICPLISRCVRGMKNAITEKEMFCEGRFGKMCGTVVKGIERYVAMPCLSN